MATQFEQVINIKRVIARLAAKDIIPRDEVVDFAISMEQRLRANDHKGGWKEDKLECLFYGLMVEVNELDNAISRKYDDAAVSAECADVANFAMMIADVVRGRGDR